MKSQNKRSCQWRDLKSILLYLELMPQKIDIHTNQKSSSIPHLICLMIQSKKLSREEWSYQTVYWQWECLKKWPSGWTSISTRRHRKINWSRMHSKISLIMKLVTEIIGAYHQQKSILARPHKSKDLNETQQPHCKSIARTSSLNSLKHLCYFRQ